MLPFHLPELLIVLSIVLLLFGAKKLPQISGALGKSVKELKAGMSDDEHKEEGEHASHVQE